MRVLLTALIIVFCLSIYPSNHDAIAQTSTRLGTVNFPKEDERTIAHIKELKTGFLRWNIRWEELETAEGIYNFEFLENQLLPYDGQEILVMMATRNPIYCAPYCEGDFRLWSYPHAGGMPNDMAAYEGFITSFVDYFGSRISFLQIDNEINEYGIYWQDTIENYKEVLAAAYRGVKNSSYPDLPVVIAGFSSGHSERLIQADPDVTADTEDVLAAGNFDYVDLHLYHHYEDIDAKVDWLRSRGYNNLITTECSGPDSSMGDYSSDWEGEKARQLVKRFSMVMENGLERINWFSFKNLLGEIPRFRYLGLVDEDFNKKPVFYTYKMFIGKVGQADVVEKISEGKYNFSVAGKTILVLWNDTENESFDATPYFSTDNLRVTRIITKEGKTDADAGIEIVSPSGIMLDENPVFVEETNMVYVNAATGDDSTGDGSLGNPWQHINYAISQVTGSVGSIVNIYASEGTYIENIVMDEYENLYGGWDSTFSERNAAVYATTIDGNNSGTAVNCASNATISGFRIMNGTASGTYCLNTYSTIISNNQIMNNSTPNNGAGILCQSGYGNTVRNNVIYGNSAGQFGGGIAAIDSASLFIKNNTIASNSATSGGDGIYCDSTSAAAVANCILWGNGDDLAGCSATYSDIEDGDAGTGNISMDPLFIDSANNDYHLLACSMCIDAGDPADDYGDEPEPNGGRINMGAFGNMPEATQTFGILSILVTPDGWGIGSIETGEVKTMAPSDALAVENDGTLTGTLSLWISDPGADWLPGAAQGMDAYVLWGLFCSDSDDPTDHFGSDDTLSASPTLSTSSIFADPLLDADGVALLPCSSVMLWLKFGAPTITGRADERAITVTVGIQPD
jgi:hypothetical protein